MVPLAELESPVDNHIAALGEIGALDAVVRCAGRLAGELVRKGDYPAAALVAEVMALAIESRVVGEAGSPPVAPSGRA